MWIDSRFKGIQNSREREMKQRATTATQYMAHKVLLQGNTDKGEVVEPS